MKETHPCRIISITPPTAPTDASTSATCTRSPGRPALNRRGFQEAVMFPGFPDNPGLPRCMPRWQPQPAPGQLRSARPSAMRYQRYQGGIGQATDDPATPVVPHRWRCGQQAGIPEHLVAVHHRRASPRPASCCAFAVAGLRCPARRGRCPRRAQRACPAVYAHGIAGCDQIASQHIEEALNPSHWPPAGPQEPGADPPESRPSCVRATAGLSGTQLDPEPPPRSG